MPGKAPCAPLAGVAGYRLDHAASAYRTAKYARVSALLSVVSFLG